jgi:hypothetical protein
VATLPPTSSRVYVPPTPAAQSVITLSPTESVAAQQAAAAEAAKAKEETLSPGAIAGIVIAALFFVVAVLAFLWCSNRHSNSTEAKMQAQALTHLVQQGAMSPAAALSAVSTQSPYGNGDPRASMPRGGSPQTRRTSRGSAGAFDHHQVYRDSEVGVLGPGPAGRGSMSGGASPHQAHHRPSLGGGRQSLSPPPHMAAFGPPPARGRQGA